MNKNKLKIISITLSFLCFGVQAKDFSQTSFTVNENGTPIPVEAVSPITPFIATGNNSSPAEALSQISKLNGGTIEPPLAKNTENDKKAKIGLDVLTNNNIWSGKVNTKSESSSSSSSITKLQVEPIIFTSEKSNIESWNKTTQNEFHAFGKQQAEKEYLKFLNK